MGQPGALVKCAAGCTIAASRSSSARNEPDYHCSESESIERDDHEGSMRPGSTMCRRNLSTTQVWP